MRELNAEFLALTVHKVSDEPDRCNVTVAPDARAFRRDAAFRPDGGGFDDGERGAAIGEGGKVGEVEGSEVPVLRRVCDAGGLEWGACGWEVIGRERETVRKGQM